MSAEKLAKESTISLHKYYEIIKKLAPLKQLSEHAVRTACIVKSQFAAQVIAFSETAKELCQ